MARKTNTAFDLAESELKGRWDSWDDLANWLANELDLAQGVRGDSVREIKHAWAYYEQQRMRAGNSPWPDAADLPSPFAPEYTDALQARLMQTVFVDPVWTVEGWGDSAKRAPFVEEFHQRSQEDERLQSYADEWVLRGLVEGVGTLEVSESLELRRERQRKNIAIQLDELGTPLHDENGPVLQQQDGQFIEAEGPDVPAAEMEIDSWEPVRLGPDYDVVPYVDFYTLPAHARNKKDIWAYAKRFYRRYDQLKAAAKKGIYSLQACEEIGEQDERSGLVDEAPRSATVVDQQGPTAQKECFEIQLLADLDGLGERWWRVTLHKESRTLLRCKVDDRTTRYIRWMPFPKPGSMDRGYSLIGNKLITVIEQDTALRNMTADRMALKVGQPIKRRQGALWDPLSDPFGPRSVIDVRDMDEVQPMQGIEDVPASVQYERKATRDDADRLVGQNDTSIGATTDESRTLGEVQLRAGYAEVRINLITKRMQEPMEELFQARHLILKRTLQTNPNSPMLQRAMVIGTSATGIDTNGVLSDGTITPDMLEGTFWGKPRGSVENANIQQAQQNFIGLLKTLPALAQFNPMIAMIFQTPPAAKALVEEMLRVFRWPDKQSFIGSEANGVFQQMQAQFEQQQMEQQMMADPRMRILMAAAGAGGGAVPGGQQSPTGADVTPPPAPSQGGVM